MPRPQIRDRVYGELAAARIGECGQAGEDEVYNRSFHCFLVCMFQPACVPLFLDHLQAYTIHIDDVVARRHKAGVQIYFIPRESFRDDGGPELVDDGERVLGLLEVDERYCCPLFYRVL